MGLTAMFDRLRKAFAAPLGPAVTLPPSGQPVSNQDVARWAAQQRIAMVAHAQDGHFDLGGDLGGHPWRLESGPPTRPYVQGLELRGRADVGADPDAAVMVLNRPLREALERHVYSSITDSLRTSVDAHMPEEMRWLAMYEEVEWPELPVSFRRHFAVVAECAEHAQRWVHAPLVSQLLNAVEEAADGPSAHSPLIVMLVRGKVYLRAEHRRGSLAETANATGILLAAAQAAQQNLPPPPPAEPMS